MKKTIKETCDMCGKVKKGHILDFADGFAVFRCNDCFKEDQSLRNYQPCEVYSRVVGYMRPVKEWNEAKRHEYEQRKEYDNP